MVILGGKGAHPSDTLLVTILSPKLTHLSPPPLSPRRVLPPVPRPPRRGAQHLIQAVDFFRGIDDFATAGALGVHFSGSWRAAAALQLAPAVEAAPGSRCGIPAPRGREGSRAARPQGRRAGEKVIGGGAAPADCSAAACASGREGERGTRVPRLPPPASSARCLRSGLPAPTGWVTHAARSSRRPSPRRNKPSPPTRRSEPAPPAERSRGAPARRGQWPPHLLRSGALPATCWAAGEAAGDRDTPAANTAVKDPQLRLGTGRWGGPRTRPKRTCLSPGKG